MSRTTAPLAARMSLAAVLVAARMSPAAVLARR
jgi:hypothetical protein